VILPRTPNVGVVDFVKEFSENEASVAEAASLKHIQSQAQCSAPLLAVQLGPGILASVVLSA
jgi:hypothetical protein